MKKLLTMLFALTASAALATDKAPPLRQAYPADLVAPGVYVIHGPTEVPNPQNQGFMNNPAIVIGNSGVVIVDPGGTVQSGDMVLEHVAKLTDKPVVAVFNSHIHGDHWLGNQSVRAKYPEVPIYGQERVGPRVIEGAGAEWVDLMMRLTERASLGTKAIGPDHPVKDGEVIKAAGLSFRIYHNDKAHTDTDIMVLIEELGVIFLGDNAGYQRMLRLEGGSFRGNVAALQTALDSGAKVFVPGHGPTGGAIAASAYRDYLQTVYDTVREGYEDGKADFEIRPMLMPRLARWKDWAGFEDTLGAHINAAFLEAEAADFE